MSLVNEPGVTPVAQLDVPVKGTWNSIAVHKVPADALYTSMNVFVREGKLRNRPGLTVFNDYEFDSAILGGGMVVTPLEKKILAVSQSYLYEYGEHDTTWTQRTSDNFAGANTRVDMAYFETSSVYVALLANELYPLKQWTEVAGAATVTATSGTIPTAKSVCIAGNRVIALIAPHTIRWSDVYSHTAWSADAIARKAQTGDKGICVRSLSALSFVLYKERSIHVARAQSGGNANAFSFAEAIRVEGPAGVYAVVEVGGIHFYMTKNGRIAMFDGSQYPQWIADGLWILLQEDINPELAKMIFGVYDYRLHTITFYYPRKDSEPIGKGMVIINLPYEGADLQQSANPHSFLGVSGVPCTFGCEVRFEDTIDRSMLFSSTLNDCQSFLSDEESPMDDEEPFLCSFQTGLVSAQNAKHSAFTFETFLERGTGYGGVLVEPVTLDFLENRGGTIVDMKGRVIDLEHNPKREYKAFNIPARFFGLKYSWSSTSKVRYAGTVIYSRNLS